MVNWSRIPNYSIEILTYFELFKLQRICLETSLIIDVGVIQPTSVLDEHKVKSTHDNYGECSTTSLGGFAKQRDIRNPDNEIHKQGYNNLQIDIKILHVATQEFF